MKDDFIDFYNLNGNILRVAPRGEEFREIEIEFIRADRRDALLYSIAALHLAFTERLGIDFVFSSYTFRKVVVRETEFTKEARSELVRAVLFVRERSGTLFRLADEHMVDGQERTIAKTNDRPELVPFEVTDLDAREFLAAVAAAWAH